MTPDESGNYKIITKFKTTTKDCKWRIVFGEIMFRIRLGIITACLLFCWGVSFSWAGQKWKKMESEYCEIYFLSYRELKKINSNVDVSSISLNFEKKIRSPKIKTKSISEKVKRKFDIIFKKAEDILNMYPRGIKVKINIYLNKKQLDKAYHKLFKQKNRAISFYVYKTNTIYTSVQHISEGVLAHEMGHCIIDHYFVILPPSKVQEILAIYVDTHLKD